jgi:hypothetical protein
MTMNIPFGSEETPVLAKPSLTALAGIIDQLWAMVVPRFSAGSRTGEAVAILRDASASPERCDWAERYLCGMVDTNDVRHSGGRRR